MRQDKSRHSKSYILLGNNIRNLRKSMHISQEELAFRISSARNYVGCVERAEKIPSIAFILDVAEALNCTIADLFKSS